jgi:hypothetical protein
MVNLKRDDPIEATDPINPTRDQPAVPRSHEAPANNLDRYITGQEELAIRQGDTQTNLGGYQCQFCDKNFTRTDNLRSHILLHAAPTKPSSRVAHYHEAVQVHAEMMRKAQRSTGLVEPNSWPAREDRGRKAEGQRPLDDYAAQLMLLDQNNKRRRIAALQEQESMGQHEAQKVGELSRDTNAVNKDSFDH